ncbi:CPBP family intramembrane metalloprotease [Hymenobacter sp. ISL-91]|uniref:CPBP family intramembrane glutamic endopeptidase n=1 Tax=Hymenobacter sp. ISL-91 TaxID=2819151 RepID=UPI001BEA10D4|nr:CPBP family intramembrane glutamic endopeptidase [Hymenobacter sp. ISL-91]MBT2556542.1 CPBP family intramembrane metalloprotease [Hymenobacter sp. ISL-91]
MKGFVSSRLHPLANLGLLLILLAVTGVLSTLLIAIISNLLYGVGFTALGNVQQQPSNYANGWEVSMLSQGLLLLGGFGGAAVALAKLTGYELPDYFTPRRRVPLGWLLLAAVLIVASMPAMTVLISWNAKLHLPEALAHWEELARQAEATAQNTIKYLTRFSSPARFVVALLVIAVVPAVSEELFFRGVIQRNLVQWTNSRHVGIWLAAAIFSAIHFQFLGFFPRFVLGLVLGYLYEWSGTILVPMAAHFAQNAFQLVLLYAQQREWSATDFDPDSTEALPLPWVLASLLLSTLLLWYLYQRMQRPFADGPPTEMHTLGRRGVAVVHATDAPPPPARTLSHDGVDTTHS